MDWLTYWNWHSLPPFMYAGRIHVRAPGHPLAAKMGGRDDYVNVARHMASVSLGRWLTWEEVVIFADDNPLNLDPANIQVITRAELMRRTSNSPNKVTKICLVCGGEFTESASHSERRETCSIPCRAIKSRKLDVSREELENLVWEMPTVNVAALFGCSDVAVAKRCRKLGIQKPPPGYWTLVKQGVKHDDALARLKSKS